MGAPKRPGNLQIQHTICKWYLPDGESSLKAQNTNVPSAQSRNQNDLTADFADSTDKKPEPIGAIRVIRGQKNLRGVRKLSGIVIRNTRKTFLGSRRSSIDQEHLIADAAGGKEFEGFGGAKA